MAGYFVGLDVMAAVVRLVVDSNMFAELEVDLVADSGTTTASVPD